MEILSKPQQDWDTGRPIPAPVTRRGLWESRVELWDPEKQRTSGQRESVFESVTWGTFFLIREDTRVHGQVLVKFREGTKRLLGAERTDH